MRKIKILGFLIFGVFLFMPLAGLRAEVNEVTCDTFSYCQNKFTADLAVETTPSCVATKDCIQENGSCIIVKTVKDGNPTVFGGTNSGNNIKGIEKLKYNALDLYAFAGIPSSELLKSTINLCLLEGISKISGVDDRDKLIVCIRKNVKVVGPGAFYTCLFGEPFDFKKIKINDDATAWIVKDLYICPTGKTCNTPWSPVAKTTTSSSSSAKTTSATTTKTTPTETVKTTASKSTLPPLPVQACKIDCKQAGFFKNTSKNCICCGVCTPDDLIGVANTALEWLFSIIGALGLAMFVYGGFLWVTSAGDSGRVAAGKKAMVNTVVGMVIMFSSGAIILTLQSKLGVSQKVTIVGKTSSASSSTGTSTNTGAGINGIKKKGDSCNVLATKLATECLAGLTCKPLKTKGSVGVCIPISIKSTVAAGGDCVYMPNDDSPSECKTGKCVKADKTTPVLGDKGKCPAVALITGECTRYSGSKTDCAADLSCWNDGLRVNKPGICLPGTNSKLLKTVEPGAVCYKLDGAPTMCAKGKCETPTNSKVGTQGTCTELSAYGGDCAKDSDCAESNSDCYGGKCIPDKTRNIAYGEACYVLDSIDNDCQSIYKCIPDSLANAWTGGSIGTGYTGVIGKCVNRTKVALVSQCIYDAECTSLNCKYTMCAEKSGSLGDSCEVSMDGTNTCGGTLKCSLYPGETELTCGF